MSDAINQKFSNKSAKIDEQIMKNNSDIPIIECDNLQELTESDSEMFNVVATYESKNECQKNIEGMFTNCIFKNVTFNINMNN